MRPGFIKMVKKKTFLIDLDDDTHKQLNKLARSKASRLKPYAEMVLKKHVEDQNRNE